MAAAYTGNDSWFVGGGHLGRWRKDTIQYTGGAGLASINLKYFGTESLPIEGGVDFNAEGFVVVQELLFRLRNSSWLVGPYWQYVQTDVTFDFGLDLPEISPPELDFRDSGVGAVIEYEQLDSTFTPSSGNFLRIEALWHDERVGGDFDYGDYAGKYLHFLKLGSWVLGGRLEGEYIDGFAPFFVEPFIRLRGIPALRYQGTAVVTGEVEARWDFHPRLSAVGFVGAGRAADGFGELGSAPSRVAGGIGIRYLFAKLLGLRLGIDVARGPEETAVYLTVGHNWRL